MYLFSKKLAVLSLVGVALVAQADMLPNQNLNNDNASVQNARYDSNDDGVLGRLSNVASSTVKKFKQNGVASWYGRQFHGRSTANGDRFDMNSFTAAHRNLPLNCYIRVTNRNNGKSVVVKVNDRGPFHTNRVLDLSYAAAKAIGIADAGTGNVTIERIDNPNS